MPNQSRRSFLKGTATALGGLAVGTTTVSAETTPDRYIVDLRQTDESALDGLDVIHHLPEIDIAVVRSKRDIGGLPTTKDVELKLERPAIETTGQETITDDELPELQWDKGAQRVYEAHETTEGEGTRIAVIDSGAVPHPDLSNLNTELSANLTTDGGDYQPFYNDHGQHVAGIACATGEGTGVVGVAPKTDFVALRVFTGPFATFGDIVSAIVRAANIDADVANLSLGAYPLPNDSNTAMLRESVERAAAFATQEGTLLVAAAGNDGTNLDTDGDVLSLPNEADDVMSVSGTGPIGFAWDDDPESGLRLTSMCEGVWRVRNPNGVPVEFSWDVYGGDESGEGIVRPNDETFFATEASDPTVRLFVDDEQVDVKAENDRQCETEEDGSTGGLPSEYTTDPYPVEERVGDRLDDLRQPPSEPAFYTNSGAEAIDVSAPGGNSDQSADDPQSYFDLIVSTTFGFDGDEKVPDYGWKAGTSMAAPQVAGVAALLRSLNPDLSARELRARIEETADDIGPAQYRGEGHLNTLAALGIDGGGDEDGESAEAN
jgi:subtilisin family serine protease